MPDVDVMTASSASGAVPEEPGLDLGYTVSVDAFSGPLDLLLFLVRKSELDIIDIPVATITDQFVALISLWQQQGELDLEVAGDFILMAATLLEIKARTIAPPPVEEGEQSAEDEDDALDPRADLIGKLLAYRRFKEAVGLLNQLEAERAQRVLRQTREEIPEDPEEAAGIDLGELDVTQLSKLWNTLLIRIGGGGPRTVMRDEMPIEGSIRKLTARAGEEKNITLRQLFAAEETLQGRISMLMATLECTRQRIVFSQQHEQYADVELRFRDEAERVITPVVFPPDEPGKKRRRRPPLVTYQAAVPPTSEDLDEAPEQPEEKHETDEERFLRELNESCDLDGVLSRVVDVEKGFQAYWDELHPPAPPVVVEAKAPEAEKSEQEKPELEKPELEKSVAEISVTEIPVAATPDESKLDSGSVIVAEIQIVPEVLSPIEQPAAISMPVFVEQLLAIHTPMDPGREPASAELSPVLEIIEVVPPTSAVGDAVVSELAPLPVAEETFTTAVIDVLPSESLPAMTGNSVAEVSEISTSQATTEQLPSVIPEPEANGCSESPLVPVTVEPIAVRAESDVPSITEAVAAELPTPESISEPVSFAVTHEPVIHVDADLVAASSSRSDDEVPSVRDEGYAESASAVAVAPPAPLIFAPEIEAAAEPSQVVNLHAEQDFEPQISEDAASNTGVPEAQATASIEMDMADQVHDDVSEPVAPVLVAVESDSSEPVSPEPVSPEPVSPEPVSPEPVSSELVSPEPVSSELVSPEPEAAVQIIDSVLIQPVEPLVIPVHLVQPPPADVVETSVNQALDVELSVVPERAPTMASEPAVAMTHAAKSTPVGGTHRFLSRTLWMLVAGVAVGTVAGWWVSTPSSPALSIHELTLVDAKVEEATSVEANKGEAPPSASLQPLTPSTPILVIPSVPPSAELLRAAQGSADVWWSTWLPSTPASPWPVVVPWTACLPHPAMPASIEAFATSPSFIGLPSAAWAQEQAWAWCAGGTWSAPTVPRYAAVVPELAFVLPLTLPASVDGWLNEPDLRLVSVAAFAEPLGWTVLARPALPAPTIFIVSVPSLLHAEDDTPWEPSEEYLEFLFEEPIASPTEAIP